MRITKKLREALFACAKDAARRAYAPYSKFRVGAALLAEDGQIFTGVNVENASYGVTICAERAAAACAVSASVRQFSALALFSPDSKEPIFPCGACLQVLAEFADDLKIYAFSSDGTYRQTSLKALFPCPFQLRNRPK